MTALSDFVRFCYAPTFLYGQRSLRTINEYATSVGYYLKLVGDPHLAEIDPPKNAKFIHGLQAMGLSIETIRKHCRNLNAIWAKAGPPGRGNRDALRVVGEAPWIRPPEAYRRLPREIPDSFADALYHATEECSACFKYPMMNYELLKTGLSSTAKLIWHVLKDGAVSGLAIRVAIGKSRTVVYEALQELVEHGFVIKIGFGLYRAREIEQSDRKTEHNDRKTEQSKVECSENRTVGTEVFGKPNSSKCSESRTESSGKRTQCSERRTDCSESRTVPAIAQKEYSLKRREEKKRKTENFKNIFDGIDRATSEFLTAYQWASKEFAERGVSPDLFSLIAACQLRKVHGTGVETLLRRRNDAEEQRLSKKIEYRWKHIASCVKEAMEIAGYEWIPCRTARRIALEEKKLQESYSVEELKRHQQAKHDAERAEEEQNRQHMKEFLAQGGFKVNRRAAASKEEPATFKQSIMEEAKKHTPPTAAIGGM